MTVRRWTVAHLRPQDEFVEVMFFDSARIYRLSRADQGFDTAIETLRRSAASRAPVGIQLSQDDEELIEAVSP